MEWPTRSSGSSGLQDPAARTANRPRRVILACAKSPEQSLLEACLVGCQVTKVTILREVARSLTQGMPDAVVVCATPRDPLALDVLHLLRQSKVSAPAVAVLPHSNAGLERELFQLGVRQFVRVPIRYEDIQKAVHHVLEESDAAPADAEPPISDFEAKQNLSALVEALNGQMKCEAGGNRVFIRSVVKGIGDKTKPRICLRCPIRQALGLNQYVFFEHIRDYCAGNCRACDAVIQYRQLGQARG